MSVHTRILRALIAPLLFVASLVGLQLTAAVPAQAYATTTTIPWPSDVSIYSAEPITAHGDGSVTLSSNSCSGTGTSTEVTLNADHTRNGTITDGTGTYRDCPYNGEVVAGVDQTVYYVSTSSIDDWHKTQTIHAVKGDTVLWTYTTSACAVTKGLTLGFDGNLYVLERTGCSTSSWSLVSFSAATGKQRFSTSINPYNDGAITQPIMPYDGGVALVLTNATVKYFGLDGTAGAAIDFAPIVPSGTTSGSASITANGRAYLITTKWQSSTNSNVQTVYYRDLTSSTINTLSFPAGAMPSYPYFHATPSGGLVLTWVTSGTQYFGSFDSSGSLTYSYVYPAGSGTSLVVDNSGDVLIQHIVTLSNNDQDVVLDSYNTVGVKTTLFDAVQQFGTSGLDVFINPVNTTTPQLGGGQYYMALCHRNSYSNVYTSYPACVQSTDNPQLISIAVPGSDYPRSAVFDTLGSQSSYVALGDSYSAGEGNPPFMEGTDNNGGDGCDRSLSGWPVTLAPGKNLRLSGFRACSGATTARVTSTFSGEPAQTDSLSSSTQVVTITIGGNDALFKDFAEKCIIGTCDSGSLEYQNSMEAINYVLPSALDSLFATLASDAPNAQIYVVGYPRVAPPAGTSCSFFTDSEKAAANDVVDGLNTDLSDAVTSAGSQFTFVDPTASGSPFIGHELCTSDPYFFGLNIAERKFSFHPNPEGMDAYQILMAYALAS